MSFNLVTAGWIAKIFIIYGLMVLAVPSLILRKTLAGRTTAQKYVICVVAGNFFYITLVLALGLVHLTNRYVLIGASLIIPAVIGIRRRQQLIELFWKGWNNVFRLVRGENSLRFLTKKFICWTGDQVWDLVGPGIKRVARNWIEWLLFAFCSGFILWLYSLTDHFGPQFSDLVIHMRWINQVDQGIIFGEGIYPFGMHALIYYIHKVFNIYTARLILLFGVVQTFYIFTMLLAFLKEICRYRYTPYLTYLAFAVGNWILSNLQRRYYAALPQELGMLFILPCAIALIHFFRSREEEEKKYRRMKQENLLYTQIGTGKTTPESTLWLWILIISFSLTLTVHFYDTIIAGCLVAVVAVVYIRQIFRWDTFRRLAAAGVLSLAIAIAPMAIAFAGGTPLEGSLYWALEVMGVDITSLEESLSQQTDAQKDQEDQSSFLLEAAALEWEMPEENSSSPEETEQPKAENNEIEAEISLSEAPEQESAVEVRFAQALNQIDEFLRKTIFKDEMSYKIWGFFVILMILMIPVLWIAREWEYSRYIMIGLGYNFLLLAMTAFPQLGLPSIVDNGRLSIFFSYTALVCFSQAADGILVLMGKFIPWTKPLQFISMILALGAVGYTVSPGQLRVRDVSASELQTDGAALCVFDIMENYPYQKWTIVSCNEERNMVSPVAWHYEAADFLWDIEDYGTAEKIYIPTQYVFFFVEKNVLNYALEPEFTQLDGHVSAEWASYDLPWRNQLDHYSGTNRIIINSRLYYWAQEYMERYPNEMKIYYEDEDFVCYFIEQNEYYLNNFAIDYGYNSGDGMDAE